MMLNYTDEPDAPLPQRDLRAGDAHEQVRWEDLESYTGSSDEEINHRARPQQALNAHWVEESQSMATDSYAYEYDQEDVQWWHVVLGEQGHGDWDGIQVLIFAATMVIALLLSIIIIWILVT